ncbi:GNAT family N-acetyltransferase [Cryobacterium psychrotolerans]|nr:GNAT family protein [Cryobacterium psychrotolerans]TFD84702.1 N-acetyltransferase [Cryobacterium psychrotolerans]
MPNLSEIWPLFDLTLRTPRLTLRPMRDEDLAGLADAAVAGIHDPAVMPFGVPWTDAPKGDLVRNLAQYQWMLRTKVAQDNWHVAFAVLLDGRVIGSQDLSAVAFSTRKTVETGSWLTRESQGNGLGKEMRAAMLMFAFDYLGADFAETSAAAWNAASIGVSKAVGYVPNGVHRASRRAGQVNDEIHFRLTSESLVRPEWELAVNGFEPVRSQLLG